MTDFANPRLSAQYEARSSAQNNSINVDSHVVSLKKSRYSGRHKRTATAHAARPQATLFAKAGDKGQAGSTVEDDLFTQDLEA